MYRHVFCLFHVLVGHKVLFDKSSDPTRFEWERGYAECINPENEPYIYKVSINENLASSVRVVELTFGYYPEFNVLAITQEAGN